MVPYFTQPSLSLGPITIYAFGALVAIGVLLGIQIAQYRAKLTGLEPRRNEDMIWYGLIIGFIVSHLFDTIAYYPEKILDDPLILLKVWDGISSFGGIVGGVAGVAYFFWRKAPELGTAERLRHLDTAAYGFPFAWIFGRLGCTLALDHPGKVTDFFLATSLRTQEARDYIEAVYANAGRLGDLPGPEQLAGMGFHNLGFYEFLYTAVVIAPLMWLLGRKRRAPGFFLAVFFLTYSPIRFFLDYLRMADKAYLGWTPAQYSSVFLVVASGYLVYRLKDMSESEATAAPKKPKKT